MHLYCAAVYTNNYCAGQNQNVRLTDYEKELVQAVPNILESWHYVGKQRYVDDMRRNGAKIFLDSGAFSAYTLGIKLSVKEYCEYIWNNWDIIRFDGDILMASVLDGIGDAQQTWQNQQEMEYYKVKPLPCFHANEDTRYLDYYVENYEYITLGGMVGASTKQLCVWLDRMWDNHMLDGAGRAKLKVHGFGITSREIMQRYPWYSCDSSSWVQSAAFGTIETPKFGPVSVSEKSPSRHDAGQHISNMNPLVHEEVIKQINDNGFSQERLATSYESRAAYNLWAYGKVNELMDATHYPGRDYRPKKQELFDG